jgi:DNA-binding IclR family transcriptional regulator
VDRRGGQLSAIQHPRAARRGPAAPALPPPVRPAARDRGRSGDRPTSSPIRAPAGVAAVLDVLESLERRGASNLAELARDTGAAKTTVHRVCAVMAERGWISRDALTGTFELGPRIAWLAHASPASALIQRFHAVAVGQLGHYDETACLTVRCGIDSVFIAKEETTQPVRLVATLGSRLPAFASASGRVLLADLHDDEVARLYAGADLVTPTGRRLKGLSELKLILRRARANGYAENIDETALGLHCLAAPIGPPGRVVAALTLCVPSGRMTPDRKQAMVTDLVRAAQELGLPAHIGG